MKKKTKTIPDKIGRKTFVIFDPIFRQRIYVLLNQDEESYKRFLNRNKIKNIEKETVKLNRFKGLSAWIDDPDGTRDYVILLKEFNWAIFHQGTLIHEITHTVMKIFEGNNIPFNIETQEFIAHEIGRLYEMIAKKLLVFAKR